MCGLRSGVLRELSEVIAIQKAGRRDGMKRG